jgi:peptidylprolyl isomerase
MKQTILIVFLAASATAATAQTPAKPATPATPVHHTGTTASAAGLKLEPAGLPPVKTIVKSAFTLRYKEIKIGTGAEAEPNKMYKVLYTGYLGLNGRPDDGNKFDSSDDHRQPLKDKDGKPVMGDDGKPKLGDAQPMSFPQGMGRLIPGFDQGFAGMKIGGKRRIFIPWQLAYGAKGRPGPDAAHPGIPPKADLIFDVELVDATDMPTPPTGPGAFGRRPGGPPGGVPPGAMPHPIPPGALPAPRSPAGTPPAQPVNPAPGSAPSSAPASTPAPTAPATTPAPATPAQPQSH